MDVIWSFFLIRHLQILLGVWLAEDQKIDTIETHCLKKTLICLQILLATPHSILRRMHFDLSSSTNVHFKIRIIITKSREI